MQRKKMGKKMSGSCPKCGGYTSKRIVPGTISGSSGVTKWQWSALIADVCIHCKPQPCMVKGCHEIAKHSLAHKYYMGKGKARVGFRNDVFVCDLHVKIVRNYRLFDLLGKIYLFFWMGFGFIYAFVLALGGENIFTSWHKIWPYLLFLVPGAGLLIAAHKWKLEKKAEYHMSGIGEFGSKWADDDFSAPFM